MTERFSRRTLMRRSLALLGGITAGSLPGRLSRGFAESLNQAVIENRIQSTTQTLVNQAVRLENQSPTPESLYQADVIDILGLGVFAKGIRELLPGGRGHIGADEYGALGGLLLTKYYLGNEKTKAHIKAEVTSSLQALTIISLSSTGAQGLRIDVDGAYERQYQKVPNLEDKIALETMYASIISPFGTTVASAAALSEEAIDTARRIAILTETEKGVDLDKDTVATLIDHISNGSGFILFGDPPWIAMAEKYGFSEAVKFQFETMLPLALSSLVSANIKLNAQILKEEGYHGIELYKEATLKAISGITKNIPFLAKSMGISLLNVARYASGALPFVQAAEQDPRGFEISIAEVFKDKLKNAITLLRSDTEFVLPIHDADFHSRIEDKMQDIEAAETKFQDFMDVVINGDDPLHHEKIDQFLHTNDFLGLHNYLEELGLRNTSVLVDVLEEFENTRAFEHIKSQRSQVSQHLQDLLPGFLGKFYSRVNLHRMHNALGSQLTDVLDVFPFQAGSVVFLTPIFHDAFTSLNHVMDSINDSVPATTLDVIKDAITYTSILGFSSVADNYVAAKIGFSLNSEKPHVCLPASIRGGTKFTISNMADLTLIPMNLYSLKDSIKRAFKGLDQDILAFVWSQVVDKVLLPMGIFEVPHAVDESNLQH